MLRGIINKPIIINSGYRSPEYNKRVGGSKNSQHVLGNAIDFYVKRMSSQQLFDILKQHGFLGKVFTGVGIYSNFIHCDVRANPHSRGFSFWDMRK